MIPIDLNGRTILLTGALGAIAVPMIRRFTAAGATVLATDLVSVAEATATLQAAKIPTERVIYRQMDVTDPDRMDAVVRELFELHPGCDTVLGHAGGCGLHGFAHTDGELFEEIVRFNFLSQTYLARSVLKQWTHRKTPGHLVFTSSYVARLPHAGISAYASAKAALENFARCLALEYASHRIRVNCVAPGNVAAGSSLRVYTEDAGYREFVERVTPFGGRNSPQAVADAFVFLCSPLAAEWNGQVLHVDWGLTLPKIG